MSLPIGWFLSGGVSFHDTATIIGALALQAILGYFIIKLSFVGSYTFLSHVALGCAAGPIAATGIDQVLVNFNVPHTRLLTLSLIIALIVILGRRSRGMVRCPVLPSDIRFVALLMPVTVLGLGTLAHGRGVVAFVGIVSCLLSSSKSIKNSFLLSFGVALLTTITQIVILFVLRPIHPPYGRLFYLPLYTGSDDQIFSESLGWSLSRFGFNDYASAPGISVKYHWFSLAWSGLVDKVAQVEPFAITLHAVPIFSILVIAVLIRLVIRQSMGGERAGIIGVLFVFGLSNQIEPARFFHVLNTSNLATYMWVLLLMFALLKHSCHELRGPLVFIPLMNSVVLLSKVPFGVITTGSVLFTLMVSFRQYEIRHRIKLATTTLVASGITFAVFLRPHSWEVRSFSVDLTLGNLVPHSYFYPLVPLLMIVLVGITTHVGVPLFVRRKLVPLERTALTLLSCASILGFVRFFVSGSSAELYFFNMTLLCCAMINALSISPALECLKVRDMIVVALIATIALLISTSNLIQKLLAPLANVQSVKIAYPLLVGGVFGLIGLISKNHVRYLRSTSFGFLVVLGVVGYSSGTLLQQLARNESFAGAADIASVEDLHALAWLRLNSPETATVATNRFLCPINEVCAFDESRFLISAVGRRKVLIEGPRFVIGGRPYPEWTISRINESIEFAKTFSDHSRRQLLNAGVTWFYLSKRFLQDPTDLSGVSKIGIIEYESPEIVIIRLRQ